MVNRSTHIETIISKHNRTANVQVVFTDIEKYSRRRSQLQISIIDGFIRVLGNALAETQTQYAQYVQANDINIPKDVLILPSGDGAGVVFSFDGLHDVHMFFATTLLRLIHEAQVEQSCEQFDREGWCNCHPSFGVRVGISEGKAIFYKGTNDGYGVAGRTVNLAARVMGLANRNQVMLSEEAFRQIVDMVGDPYAPAHFREYRGIHLKDGEKVNVYQYLGTESDHVDPSPAASLSLKGQFEAAARRFKTSSAKLPANVPEVGGKLIVDLVHGIANAFTEVEDRDADEAPEPEKE
jgi:class 3 adenylate cyclase